LPVSAIWPRVRAAEPFDAVNRSEPVPGTELAVLAAALGRTDEAVRWLDKAFDEHSYTLVWRKLDPRLDPLRRNPRFDARWAQIAVDHERACPEPIAEGRRLEDEYPAGVGHL
jgi:hypothetical protein